MTKTKKNVVITIKILVVLLTPSKVFWTPKKDEKYVLYTFFMFLTIVQMNTFSIKRIKKVDIDFRSSVALQKKFGGGLKQY